MLIVLGHRRNAIDVACRRYPMVLQYSSQRTVRATPPNLISLPLDDIPTLATRLAGYGKPRGVVALTEGSVTAAAALRAQLELPGNASATAEACTDKLLMKSRAVAAGVRTTRFLPVDAGDDGAGIAREVGLPLVLKRIRGSGGRQLQVIESLTQWPRGIEPGWMAESFVDGIEMSVESFVRAGTPVFTNFTQYLEPRWANIVPADTTNLPVDEIRAVNAAVIEALEIDRGMTHMEVFVTPSGVLFSEIAIRPPGGYIMDLLELAYGFPPWDAVFEIECGGAPKLPGSAQSVAGVRLFHPGAGTVVGVAGEAEVRALSGLTAFRNRARVGEQLPPREGAGQSIAHAIFAGERDTVIEGLQAAGDQFLIEMN